MAAAWHRVNPGHWALLDGETLLALATRVGERRWRWITNDHDGDYTNTLDAAMRRVGEALAEKGAA